jgi:hypothetical protein
MKKEQKSPRLRVSKQTIRNLDARAISPDDLAQVHGGIVLGQKYSYRCTTSI